MTDGHDLLEVIDAIDPRACSYAEWTSIGMGLKDAGHSCSAWESWSRSDPRFHEGECAKKWQSFRGSSTPVTGGTIVAIARSQGWQGTAAGEGYALDWD
ncbi:MAG: PriCT-2 domain-containing protein, partial [Actinomycetes bacterium]